MGTFESSLGANRPAELVQVFGFQDVLSLDGRGRFRLPDELAAALHRAMARAAARGGTAVPPAAFERLSFYFVPAPGKRVFLYPTTNIALAVERFENPPPGMDPAAIRGARDYFYYRMRFVEADKQNRLQIPDGLREHAEIGPEVQQVALVAHNHWLTLMPGELVKRQAIEQLDAFEASAPDLLDPMYRRSFAPTDDNPPDPIR